MFGSFAQNNYITPDLIRWYAFDAGTRFDSSKTKYHLISYNWNTIVTGTTIPSNILISGATYFTGGTGTVNANTKPKGALSTNEGLPELTFTGDLTIMCWVKCSDISYSGFITPLRLTFNKPTGGGDSRNQLLFRGGPPSVSTSNWYVQHYNGTASDSINASLVRIDTNWHHLVAKITSGTLKYYYDGIFVGQDTSLVSALDTSALFRVGVAIGADIDASGVSNGQTEYPMKGYVDDVRVYKVALTDAQITEIYKFTRNNYNLSGTYTFWSSTTFDIPAGYSSFDYLVVGGGGSGGGTTTNNSASGGGGGGEVIEGTISNPSGGTYTITIGAGGSAIGSASATAGNAGGDSKINSALVVAKGGKGGAGSAAAAGNASSNEGSGGGSSVAGFTSKGTGTHTGGDGTSTSAAGGGGGSGGNGSTSTSTTATADGGGVGTTSSFFGGTYGAGGGSWAVHGTARGGVAVSANTGNGSVGKMRLSTNISGSAGGSGIIIIRLNR